MKRATLTAAVLAASAFPGYLQAAPAIGNAGFNNPSVPPVLTGGASLGFAPGYFNNPAEQAPQEGSGALVLHGVGTATLTISSMIVNAPYRLTYGEAQLFNSLANDLQVKVGTNTVVPDYFPVGALWVDRSVTFAASAATLPLEIDGVYSDNSGDRTSLVDNVRITPVYIWQANSAGNWGTSANWVGSAMPSAIDQIAIFGQTNANGSVNLDANRTVGALELNSQGGPYLIGTSNSSSLTLQASSGAASITDMAGSHTISAPLVLKSSTTFAVNNPSDTLTLSGPITAAGVSITQQGTGTIAVAKLVTDDLQMNEGMIAILPNGASTNVSILGHVSFSGTLVHSPGPRDLAISPSGALDVNDNDVIIKSGYTLDQVRDLIQYGYAFGFWGGQGITSRAAAETNGLTGLGYMQGSAFNTQRAGDLFDGQSVGGNDMLIKYTFMGDADLDGRITMGDYARIDAGFLLHAPLATWTNGDFNYDGVVNYQDYALIDAAFVAQGGGVLANDMISEHSAEFGSSYGADMLRLTAGSVPEPASLSLLGLGAMVLMRRRRQAFAAFSDQSASTWV